MKTARLVAALLCTVALASELSGQDIDAPTPATQAIYAQMSGGLDWDDERDFSAAERGLIARYPTPEIRSVAGALVWTFPDYAAMRDAPPPAGVHPVLWRQSRLNAAHGLFEVVPGVYQLRGFDLANMTVIEGESGIIVVDPLTSVESASAALELYYANRPQRPVVAVIYTHSHMDHYGGVRGVVKGEDVTAGKVQIIAPEGFLREAVSENVTAGNAMLRRTIYYSGLMVPAEQRGSLGAGLGAGVANGEQSFIAPTEEIPDAGETRVIDGINFVFHGANNTEAPSELMFYLPDFGVLNVAEVATRTVHNVLTPRGAQVRDTDRWWRAIDDVLQQYGDVAQVMVAQHHWPSFGRDAIREHLENQRDFYKFAHDRSLHLANRGFTMDEIAAQLELPASLSSQWALQDYYGTLGSAGRAVFQHYLGWYDGNPANLDPLPNVERAQRTIAYMGGADAVLERAHADFAAGEYRWVADVLNDVVFADPDNAEARELQAQALTQLGYQQISATWRNLYLTAARELREGVVPIPASARSGDFLSQMSVGMLLDFAGIALSAERSAGMQVQIALFVEGAGEATLVEVADGLLRYRPMQPQDAATRASLSKTTLDALLSQRLTAEQALRDGQVLVSGEAADVVSFFALFDSFTPNFNLVKP